MSSPAIWSSLLVLCAAPAALGGDLNPPVGPVAPTPGPEPRIAINTTNTPGDANSLYKITAPGSYYLTGNITGVAAKHGIEITSGSVTIDLMGFELRGATASLDGIASTSPGLPSITITNGTIWDWGGDGIDLSSSSTINNRVERVASRFNGGTGMILDTGSVVTACMASDNDGPGFNLSPATVITDSTAVDNGTYGFNLGGNTTISRCVAQENGSTGINAGAGSVVTECSSYLNGAIGIFGSTGTHITGCAAYQNGADGIVVQTACSVRDCTAEDNQADGIQATTDCKVVGNNCDSNTGAGIVTTGADCRIDSNTCTDNAIGIEAKAGGSVFVRNMCSGNTTNNWDIAANNFLIVIDATGAGVTAFTGNAGGTTLGSSNPWANFSY